MTTFMHQRDFVEAMRRPPTIRRRVVDVFVIPCSEGEELPADVLAALQGWELRVHRMECGHTMGPYLLRQDGKAPPSELVCWECQKAGARLRGGNSMSSSGTSKP